MRIAAEIPRWIANLNMTLHYGAAARMNSGDERQTVSALKFRPKEDCLSGTQFNSSPSSGISYSVAGILNVFSLSLCAQIRA